LILLKKRPEIAHRQEINENDERFIKIKEKSAQDTWYVTLIGLLVAEFVFVFQGAMVPMIITIALMAVHVISYLIFLYINDKKL